MSDKTTYESLDNRIAPEALTEDHTKGLAVVDGHAVKSQEDYEDPNRLYDMLIARIRKYHPSTDVSMIEKAYKLAVKAHGDQRRKSGEPYIIHPLWVAIILADLEMDKETIAAGMRHDVVEDTKFTEEDIRKEFGAEVALLVDGVTKLGRLSYSSDKLEVQAENLRKMFLAMAKDIRVIIIKLADRLHNMRTLHFLPPEKRSRISKETLNVYAPMADQLGIWKIKEELSDRAIMFLDPCGCYEIEKELQLKDEDAKNFIEKIQQELRKGLEKSTVIKNPPEVTGRVKSLYSIYRKVYAAIRKEDMHEISEVYDKYAARIIVDTVEECYVAMSVVGMLYQPLPNRTKDYIAMPKPNGYRSIHMTVYAYGLPFEVQIRTHAMHQAAEYGIVAHWKYKQGETSGNMDQWTNWARKLIEEQQNSDDMEEFVRNLKNDARQDVGILTPKGKRILLPKGSTPIDFAYAIHSAVGNKMVGAKVDGRIVPLDYVVKTGEIVEVLTSSQTGKGPSRDWLSIAKTSQARNKIRSWFKNERRDENIAEGKAEVDREFKRNFIRLCDENYEKFVANLAERQHLRNVDDFYAAIGYGGISVIRLMPYIKEEYNKNYRSQETVVLPEDDKIKTSRRKGGSDGVTVSGIDNCLIKFSRCCNPLPGDNIIGFITRGHGVSIHKRDCPNVPSDFSKCDEPQRWVAAAWNTDVKTEFKASLIITCLSRIGFMADVSVQLAAMKVNINEISSRETKDGRSQISMTITVSNVDHLKNVIARLKKVDGVLSVER